MIDEHLDWNEHIKLIQSKFSKNVGILGKLKSTFPRHALLMLYNSLILPYLNYSSMIWANEYNKNKLHKIYILQKKAVRIICNMNYTAHAAPGFKSLKLLTIMDISKLQLCEFMFKYSKNLLPNVFQQYFNTNANFHPYVTRHANDYHRSSVRTCVGKCSISSRGSKIWNAMPNEIKSAPSLQIFKARLKSTFWIEYT